MRRLEILCGVGTDRRGDGGGPGLREGPPARRPRRLRGPRPGRRAAGAPWSSTDCTPGMAIGSIGSIGDEVGSASSPAPATAGTRTPSEGRSRTAPLRPRYEGATVSISSHSSSTVLTSESVPRAAASSVAIIQSGQARPGGTSFWPRRLTRPSTLVVVPERSCTMAAGKTMSACSSSLPGWQPTTTRGSAAARARSARAPSGKSPRGSPPRRTRPRTLLLAAPPGAPSESPFGTVDGSSSERDERISRASRPRSSGTEPHAVRYQARPDSRATRPGSRPGARPMSRAPWTLPRRRAERNRAPGHARASRRAASATTPACSAIDGRPSTTTTPAPAGSELAAASNRRASSRPSRLHEGPSGWASRPWTTLSSPVSASATPGASPGRSRSDTAA